MIIIIISLIVGYIIGRIHSYYNNRIQCVNCGSHNTCKGADGFVYTKGSKSNFAAKNWEGHTCNDCGALTSVIMKL
jgi:hypothetical protein